MNLPVDGIEFLDIFFGFLNKADGKIWNENNLPIIYINGFICGDSQIECKEKFLKRINKQLPNLEEKDIIEFTHVKNVTISK